MKLNDFSEIHLIEKGWSSDKKYCVTATDGTRYLLRISDKEHYKFKRFEFEMMKKAAALGIPMCRPLEFGVCDQGVYSLQTWIDGEDAEFTINQYPQKKIKAFGIEAGRSLKKIHSIAAPEDIESWDVHFNRKIDRNIKGYKACGIAFEGAEKMIDYINQNRYLLKNRPQCYQHGDYHLGNMMLAGDNLVIIDFNRNNYGDPWEEFNRIVWCAQSCPAFACNMVEGYFDGTPPPLFWQLLALYIGSNTLSSIFWAIPFGKKEVASMLSLAKEILLWYDNMRNFIPKWYKATNHIND